MPLIPKPTPPRGSSNEASWHRQLLAYLDRFGLHEVIGGKKIPHPEGGYSILIDKSTSGGAEVEVILCVEGVPTTYLLRGRLKPEPEE